ncbi:glycosyltransferase family 9 protein [Georgenia deserti]|uniref:Glycosyltransferase family 9 protein n=1 Tax=Georgenia deserti TaxID=2093781 RepID=A0ABW4L5U6_9MICO
MSRTLAVRLDNEGDVLLTGPALRALAATTDILDVLVAPSGLAAAELLPEICERLVYPAPWSGFDPPPVDAAATRELVAKLACRGYDRCVVFTSYHQSPLPMALLARLAGIGFVAATSEDYPGSLLSVRHRRPDGLHEVEAALDLAYAAGGRLPAGDDGRPAVQGPLPDVGHLLDDDEPYVVVHPGASVPARALTAEHAGSIVEALRATGWRVVVTGGPGDARLTAPAAARGALDLGGRTSFAELATVLAHAHCVVVGNTGPAHLATAVDTPVVSLFSPVVPAERWAPYGRDVVVLGDQRAACANTRARECPVPGHPCVSEVDAAAVVAAVAGLTTGRAAA